MDVRTFGSRTSAQETLFPALRAMGRRILVLDICPDVPRKNFLFGLLLRS